jgi:hypothetical protein
MVEKVKNNGKNAIVCAQFTKKTLLSGTKILERPILFYKDK